MGKEPNPDLNNPKRSGYDSIRIHNTVFNGTSLGWAPELGFKYFNFFSYLKIVNIFIPSFLTAHDYIVKGVNFCPSTKYLAVRYLYLYLSYFVL